MCAGRGCRALARPRPPRRRLLLRDADQTPPRPCRPRRPPRCNGRAISSLYRPWRSGSPGSRSPSRTCDRRRIRLADFPNAPDDGIREPPLPAQEPATSPRSAAEARTPARRSGPPSGRSASHDPAVKSHSRPSPASMVSSTRRLEPAQRGGHPHGTSSLHLSPLSPSRGEAATLGGMRSLATGRRDVSGRTLPGAEMITGCWRPLNWRVAN